MILKEDTRENNNKKGGDISPLVGKLTGPIALNLYIPYI